MAISLPSREQALEEMGAIVTNTTPTASGSSGSGGVGNTPMVTDTSGTLGQGGASGVALAARDILRISIPDRATV